MQLDAEDDQPFYNKPPVVPVQKSNPEPPASTAPEGREAETEAAATATVEQEA